MNLRRKRSPFDRLWSSVETCFDNLLKDPLCFQDLENLRVKIEIEPMDPLHWLQNQPHSSKVYWQSRENEFICAGVGAADIVLGTSSQALHQYGRQLLDKLGKSVEGVRYYGGLRFSSHGPYDSCWSGFHQLRFVLPRVEVQQIQGRTFIVCNLHIASREQSFLQALKKQAKEELHNISWVISRPLCFAPDLSYQRTNQPILSDWKQRLMWANQEFSSKKLEKVVLARKTDLFFEESLCPLSLLSSLRETNQKTFLFCIQTSYQNAFLGASPELLYRRKGHRLEGEAIAGTRRRGRTDVEDHHLGQELLRNKKELHEHSLVLEMLRSAFQELCSSSDVLSSLNILKLQHVQHIWSRIEGRLRENTDDIEILSFLHPTPAVGGRPRARALAAISEWEKFDRGWYAAPVGWVGTHATEFSVAIRTGLLKDTCLSLFSGAGIVPASQSQYEWNELEHKLNHVLSLLGKQRDVEQGISSRHLKSEH